MSKPRSKAAPKKPTRARQRPVWELAAIEAMEAVARVDPTFPSDLIGRAIRDAYRGNGYDVTR